MSELIKNILFAIIGMFAFYLFMSDSGGWRELAEKYRTEDSLPKTFLITEDQRITFSQENKSSSASFPNYGESIFINKLGEPE